MKSPLRWAKNCCGLLRHLLFRQLIETSPNFPEGLHSLQVGHALDCDLTSVCQHLSSLTARLSVIVFLKARLSEACRCMTVVRLVSSVVGHPRPSHCVGTGVPWVSCLDPRVCLRVQDDPEAKSQLVVVLG